MNNTTILTGCLCEVRPEAVILAAGTRIALPPALSTAGVPVGSSVLVKVTRGARPQPTTPSPCNHPKPGYRPKPN